MVQTGLAQRYMQAFVMHNKQELYHGRQAAGDQLNEWRLYIMLLQRLLPCPQLNAYILYKTNVWLHPTLTENQQSSHTPSFQFVIRYTLCRKSTVLLLRCSIKQTGMNVRTHTYCKIPEEVTDWKEASKHNRAKDKHGLEMKTAWQRDKVGSGRARGPE